MKTALDHLPPNIPELRVRVERVCRERIEAISVEAQ
jgi:hypothetical protein